MSHLNDSFNSNDINDSESLMKSEYCKQLTVFPLKAGRIPHAGKMQRIWGAGQKDKIYLFATHSVTNTQESQNVFGIL